MHVDTWAITASRSAPSSASRASASSAAKASSWFISRFT
jgi:hypothetical protein